LKANDEGKPLKDVLQGVMKKLDSGELAAEIINAWEKIIDTKDKKHTKPVSFKQGRLVVIVSDSSRLYDLTVKKKEIINIINAHLRKGKIKEIRFKIGEIR